MYFTDAGIEELDERRGDEQVTMAWLAERLRDFVDLNPEFETAVDRLAKWLARPTPTTTATPTAIRKKSKNKGSHLERTAVFAPRRPLLSSARRPRGEAVAALTRYILTFQRRDISWLESEGTAREDLPCQAGPSTRPSASTSTTSPR